MKCICSRLRYRAAITGLGLAVVALAATPAAWAHIDPPGATLAGVGGSLGVFTDATCSQALTGPVLECATIYVQTSLQWQSNPPGNAAFEAGFWRLTAAPGGVNPALIQNLGAVPCIGGTLDDPNSIANNGRGLCFEAAEVLPSDCIPYAITAADAAAGFVTIQALYGDANPLSADTAFSHRSEGDNPGASATSTESVVVNLCNAPEEECREAERCDPALNDGLGACVQDDKADSTTCTDDSLDCYIAGCEEGVCVQDHTPVAASTPCDEVAGTECADPGCDGAGTCVATHIPKADSTTCTDDSLDCSIAGCESGVCVQDHTPVAASTPCDEVAGTECADPGCDGAGTCVATHIPKADSTTCTDDSLDCSIAGCESGVCVQDHTPVAASTPCDEVAGTECADPGCDGAGTCVATHIPKADSTTCTDDSLDCSIAGCESGVCVQDHTPVAASTPCDEVAGTECADPGCDGAGTCVATHIPKADSTTCTDDSLDCSIAGCESGVCVQDHTPVAASTPCDEVAGTECADPGCDGAGTCVATHIPKADSTTCTDDSLDCSIAGCESGVCVQDHTPVAASTPCDEVAGTECADPGCDGAGTCVATHIPKADSTDCTDTGEDCWDAGCESGACVQEHTPVAASTPCTDTGDECFDAGCDGAGICNQEHTEICVPDLACRTVGFWGARGGSEKGGFNFTQAAIDAAGGQLDVCGEAITRSNSDVLDLGDLGHALEAICVNNRQGPQIQLYRQMTAAALNCAASAGTDDCTGIIPLDGVTWAQCNTACIAGDLADPTVVRSCKNQFDCFNNGGQFVGGQCYEGICVELLRGLGDLNDFMLCNSPADCSGGDDDDDDGGLYECVPIPGNCHDQDFCDGPMVFPPDSDLCYSHKRNSSPRACWAASRNDCTIVECLP